MSETFYRIKCANTEEWLKEREKHLQASDAASILEVSPWKSKTQLWDEKKGLKKPEDISNKPNVIYGKKMEPYIRAQVLLDLPYFECEYHEFDILVNKDRPWQACTLDGELTVTANNPWNLPIGAKGVLECKTGRFGGRNTLSLYDWVDFPENYLKQQLHQLAVTEWDFNISASRIIRDGFKESDNGFPEVRTLYHMVMTDNSLEDIRELIEEEKEFWKTLNTGIRPTYRLPE